MGKIGILTFHRSVNNGAVMQAYSLSKRLAAEYPDTEIEIIDFHMKKIEDLYQYGFWKSIKDMSTYEKLKNIVRIILDPKKNVRLNKRTEIFKSVIEMLPLSEVSIVDDSTEKIFKYIDTTYDVLIVGSDAVWNYVLRGFPNAYFPDKTVKCHKMSYAASCYGMDFIEYSKTHKTEIKDVMDDFSFIGVRDCATENFVKWSGSTNDIHHTCDPTVFLDVNDLPIDVGVLIKKLKKRHFDFNRPAIGMMGNEKMCSMIRKMFGNKYQVVALYQYIKNADVNLYDLNPYEWAYVFRYFKLTFTTYFHGTLLSLRNGIPVICIALETEFARNHTSKTEDVLTRLGFSDWYFATDYKNENFDKIKIMAEKLLSEDNREMIIKRMNDEAESFCTFKTALEKIINKGEKEND